MHLRQVKVHLALAVVPERKQLLLYRGVLQEQEPIRAEFSFYPDPRRLAEVIVIA